MEITRINNDRNLKKEVTRIDIRIGDKVFQLTEEFRSLSILKIDEGIGEHSISVKPHSSNVINIV